MDEMRTPDGVRYRVLKVWCRRLARQLPVQEHAVCPYCDGDLTHIRTARHKAFCDYRPGVDPVRFGFPTDRGRYRT
jgi:hypothetical protein